MAKRLMPRYKGPQADDEKIRVNIVQIFPPREEIEGTLYDLTEQAIKVCFDDKHLMTLRHYMLKAALLSFRLADHESITVSKGFLLRIDNLTGGQGFAAVFMFDLIMEPDRQAIKKLCEAFERPEGEAGRY